jgi:hydroxyacyl-ACP dehydratase HTD2-like protein with hotdog domain
MLRGELQEQAIIDYASLTLNRAKTLNTSAAKALGATWTLRRRLWGEAELKFQQPSWR